MSGAEEPVYADLDEAQMEMLRSVMDAEALRDLVRRYLMHTDEAMARLALHVRTGAFDEAAREAHMLVGAAGNMGAIRVAALARSLEQGCKAGDTTAVPLTEALQGAVQASAARLSDWLIRHAVDEQ